MSFDTEFDYTPIIDGFNAIILNLENERDSANVKLNIFANLDSKYQSLTTDEAEYFTTLRTKISKDINNYGNIIADINDVQNLSNIDKDAIYDYYITYVPEEPVERDRVYWMRSMVGHMPDMANDIGNLMADVTITPTEANVVADLICRKYEPLQKTMGFGHIYLTYLRSL